MDEIVKEFLIESSENLDRLDQELIRLESDPSSKELLASIFRTIHTIKGSCGFLGFPRLEKVTHTGENLLARLRDGELRLNTEITNALLALVDAIRRMLASIRDSGQDGDQDFTELIERLAAFQKMTAEPEDQPSANSSSLSPQESLNPASPKMEPPASVSAVETIRVGVNVMDRLMNLVGELVLARNRLSQFDHEERDGSFHAATQRLKLITGNLQDEIMKARLQPISTVWNKFPRVVRDLAQSCRKEVRLEMEGADTELDRSLLEAIRDPLVHLLRNAIDHGIETPELRKQAGKNPCGKITLRAFHEAGRINVEVFDDGAGLSRDRICRKALERGLITAEQAADMPDGDIYQLIFRPGFSTAEKITSVSGRGVGMDVVKTNIEAIGGIVGVHSHPGQGTTFAIRIPLTLAIIPALIVHCGGERFAIPQASLIELVRLEAGSAGKIENIQGTHVFRRRGKLLPLLALNHELQLPHRDRSGLEEQEAVSIIVVCADKHEFGIVVDEIIDTHEIVVKPLTPQVKRIGVYAGATILGDGRVALILDIHGLAERARLTSRKPDSLPEIAGSPEPTSLEQPRQPALIVQCPDRSLKAIPLSGIWRLEEILPSQIEMLGTQEVMQYNGEIVPLLGLASNPGATATFAANASIPVVVCQTAGRKIGLVFERFLDITEDTPHAEEIAARNGLLRATVIQHQVAEVLDVPRLVRELLPAHGQSAAEAVGM